MGIGGAQKIQAFVANTLESAGYEVVALNMKMFGVAHTINLSETINIVDLHYDLTKTKSRFVSPIYKICYLMQLRKMIKEIKPDLIYAFKSDIARMIVAATMGMKKVRLIASERGDPKQYTKKRLADYNWAYNKCDGVVFQFSDVQKFFQLKDSVLVDVIPNPCVPRNNVFAQRSELSRDSHIILSAGRFSEQKRFDLLIDAFDVVYAAHPEYKLVIYGDGPLYQNLLERKEKLKSFRAIELPGDTKDVFTKAKDAEFFVLSSDYEGIPNVLIEAMAIGMPCISTDCSPGGARYLLKNGKLGLLTPCGDVGALTNAILCYIENKDMRNLMGEVAKSVNEEYKPDVISEKWVAFTKKVLSLD